MFSAIGCSEKGTADTGQWYQPVHH